MSSLFRRWFTLLVLGILMPLMAGPFIFNEGPQTAHAQSRGKKKQAKKPTSTGKKGKNQKKVTRKKVSKKNKKKYAPKRRRRAASGPAIPRIRSINADSMVVEDIAAGVSHQWLKTEGKHVANILRVDLKSNARLRSFKALDRYDGLEKVRDIFERADSLIEDTLVAATNASFWKATYNSPIGATITNGEVIEMPGYKSWSSLMIHEDGTASIDRIRLHGEIFWRHRKIAIEAVNRRGLEQGLVVYNHYYGDQLPRGSRKSDSAIIAEVFANEVSAEIGDDTEQPVTDTAGLIQSYRRAMMQEDREYPLLKVACVFMEPKRKRDPLPRPVVGDTMSLIVSQIDTGAVEIPEDGFVFSLGVDAEYFPVVNVGDTIRLLYSLTPKPAGPVRDLLTGTPRIVRDGVARPEHDVEGSKASRFVQGALSRTGVGISQDGDTLIVVTINSSDPGESTSGMTLTELANFMVSLGAYQAINFDGGGSATMVIDGETVSRQRGVPFNRRVSNAILVVKEKAREKERAKKPRMPIEGR